MSFLRHSHVVSRPPCSSGRVSSANTRSFLPRRTELVQHRAQRRANAGRGQRAGVAVGDHSDCAVRTRRLCARVRPIRRFAATSSDYNCPPISRAQRQSPAGPSRHWLRRLFCPCSSTHLELTAVGRRRTREGRRRRESARRDLRSGGAESPRTSPYAAATPMAGAPGPRAAGWPSPRLLEPGTPTTPLASPVVDSRISKWSFSQQMGENVSYSRVGAYVVHWLHAIYVKPPRNGWRR